MNQPKHAGEPGMTPEQGRCIIDMWMSTYRKVFFFWVLKSMLMIGQVEPWLFYTYLLSRYKDSCECRWKGDHGLPWRMVQARELVDPAPIRKQPHLRYDRGLHTRERKRE